MKNALSKPPKVDRLEASKDPSAGARVDREGGRYGAGMIHRVSLCSRGEALGHYMWIDNDFLAQLEAAAPSEPKLLKSRFTHPDWCSDGMGKALGTFENFELDGDQIFADLHFYAAAHDAPDGDLASYVMNLAEEDPANFGTSIVFTHDWDAEDEFRDEHTQEIELKDDAGNVVTTRRQFVSPDPLNTEHLMHCRLKEFRACDVVDEPAANPNGLFHRENAVLQDGAKILDFVFGRSKEVPALSSALGVDVAPERLKSFVSKYLANAGLSLNQEDDEMPGAKSKAKLAEGKEDPKDEKKDPPPADEKKSEESKDSKAGEGDEEDPRADDEPADDEADKKSEGDDKSKCSDPAKADLAKFCSAFGNADGAEHFLAGVSFEDAQTKHIEKLTAERDELQGKVAAFADSGVDPVKFNAAKDPKRDKTNAAAGGGSSGEIVDNRAKFAALNPVPKIKDKD